MADLITPPPQPYREASDGPPPPAFPPRTRPPSNPGMGSTFDRLVDSNLQLVRTLRIAIIFLMVLAAGGVIVGATIAHEVHNVLGEVLRRCQ